MDNKVIIALLVIVFFAALLRFYDVHDYDLRFPDEGIYLGEANWLITGVMQLETWQPFSSLMPFFLMILSTGVRILGYQDFIGMLIAAFFSTMSVLLVFFMGRALYNWKIGILSSIIFSLFGMEMIHARSGLTETMMMFFFTAAVTCYVLSKKGASGKKKVRKAGKRSRLVAWIDRRVIWIFFSGVLAALSFEVKYLAFFVVIPILFSEFLFWVMRRQRFKEFLLNVFIFTFGFMVVFCIFWAFYSAVGFDYVQYFIERARLLDVFNFVISKIPWFDHIGVAGGSKTVLYGGDILRGTVMYVYYAYQMISPAVLLLVVLGLYYAVRKRSLSDIFMLVWFLLTCLFLFKIAHGTPRDVMFFNGLFVILAARGFFEIMKNVDIVPFRKYSFIRGGRVLLILFIIFQLIHLYPFVTYNNSAFRETGEFLLEDGVEGTIATTGSLIAVYTNKRTIDIRNESDLHHKYISNRSSDFSHLVLDTWYIDELSGPLTAIYEEAVPVKKIDYDIEGWIIGIPFRNQLEFIGATLPFLDGSTNRLEDLMLFDSTRGTILIYRLEDLDIYIDEYKEN